MAALLVGAFAVPLWQLARYAASSSLQSHILLIPFVAAYLVWSGPKGTIVEARASTRLAVLAGFLGALVMGAYLASLRFAGASSLSLTLSTAGFLIFLLAVALGTLGWPALRPHRFAILFLLFAIPLPEQVTDFLSRALQHASAEAADLTFRLTGMPLLRQG